MVLTEALLELLLNHEVEPKDIYVFPQKIHSYIRFDCDGIARNNSPFYWVKCIHQFLRAICQNKLLYQKLVNLY